MGEKIFYVKMSFDNRPDNYFTIKALSASDAAEKIRHGYANRETRVFTTFTLQDHPFSRGRRPGRPYG